MRPGLVALLLLAGCSRGAKSSDAGAPSPSPVASVSASTSVSADVVSKASESWDAGPPVVGAGKVDAAALRARTHARLDHDTSKVTVLTGDEPRSIGERLCEAVVPKRPKETPILLKPNLGGFEWFKNGKDDGVKGRITDPEFVRGVIQCLKKRGHTRITVAEGWGATHADWKKLIEVSGYAAMTADEHVPLVAMDDDGVFDVEGDQPGKPLAVSGMEKTRVPTLLVPKILAEHLDHGLFISIPKIKAHRFGVFSAAIKGVQGTIMLSDAAPAFRQKARMHRELNAWLKAKEGDRAAYVAALETFGERIADVLEVEAPHVVLAEGAPGMMGDGFQKLFPTKEKLGVGGTHPVAVDRVVAHVLGLWDNAGLAAELGGHRTSPLLTIAAKRFGLDLARVETTGDGAALIEGPRPTRFFGMAGFELGSGAAPPTAAEPPTVHAAQITRDVELGKSDPLWAKAKEIAWATDFGGETTPHVTRARFLFRAGDEGALYASFDVEGTGLFVDDAFPLEAERAKLYQEDCVELFVDPTPTTPKQYFEIEVGPKGHFLDLSVDHGKSDVGWSSKLTRVTRVDPAKKSAHLELRLAAPEIVKALSPGARLRLGLYRMEGKAPRRYLAWSPPRTKKPNFHVPEAFGWLVLDP